MRVTALQQDEFFRQQFMSKVSVYLTEMMVFIDETDTDRRSLVHKHGYSMPLRNYALFVRRACVCNCSHIYGWTVGYKTLLMVTHFTPLSRNQLKKKQHILETLLLPGFLQVTPEDWIHDCEVYQL